jgi:hypothetical protein
MLDHLNNLNFLKKDAKPKHQSIHPINELKEIILSQYNISKVEVDDILSTFISYGLLDAGSSE